MYIIQTDITKSDTLFIVMQACIFRNGDEPKSCLEPNYQENKINCKTCTNGGNLSVLYVKH